MVKYCVSTDSGCDLPATFCQDREIYAYRMKYVIGDKTYTDQMNPEDSIAFYNKMRAGDVPRTSQMTPNEFIDFWSTLYEKLNLPIVHVAMGSGISGTYSNAVIARDMFVESHPDAKVFVVDSTLASIGYGMLCIWAADMRDAGETPENCVEWLEMNRININTYYTCDDLKYLYRSGRVSKTGAAVGTILNINPILNLDKEGHLIVQEKVRGRKKAFRRIYEIVEERVINPSSQTVYICHSDCSNEDVKTFSETLINRIGFKDSFISYISSTIGSHCGPGLIAAFFVGKPRF
ncbi:MAG: DegV family protein [Clostridiales bacterium]|jgi:DegV family protein with EDD domain|nr:DegV family protein [Clostridiales bacterium]